MKLWKNNDGRACFTMAMLTAVALVLCIAGNLLLGLIPYNTAHPDLTDRQTFEVSDETLAFLGGVDEDVAITFLCEGGKSHLDPDLYAFLSRYAEASEHITLRVIDHTHAPEILAEHGVDAVSDMSLIVESARRYRVIDNAQLYYYLNSTYQLMMTPVQYEAYLAECDRIDSTGEFKAEFASLTVPYFDGEFCLTNAINFVTRADVTVAYTLLGNGASTLDGALTESLMVDCYDHKALQSLSSIPADCELLIMYAPTEDLSDAEAQSLSHYLANGGKLILATHYENGVLPKLESVLSRYGLRFGEIDALVSDGENAMSVFSGTLPEPFISYVMGETPLGRLDCQFTSWLAHPILRTEVEGVEQTSLIHTTEKGSLWRYDEENGKWNTDEKENGVYETGVVARCGNTEILWLSCAVSLMSGCNAYTEDGGNFVLFKAAADSMGNNLNTGEMLSAKPFDVTTFTPTESQTSLWRVLLIFLIPLIPAVIGTLSILSKRRR